MTKQEIEAVERAAVVEGLTDPDGAQAYVEELLDEVEHSQYAERTLLRLRGWVA